MQELDYHTKINLLQRFPSFELSYETVLHNKVEPHYNVAIAIALGKKCFAWFSFDHTNHICYLMELNKEKKIAKIGKLANTNYPLALCLGTIIYGTLAELPDPTATPLFIVEDIYQCSGVFTKPLCFGDRMYHLVKAFQLLSSNNTSTMRFEMAGIWRPDPAKPCDIVPAIPHLAHLGYTPHHIQYRATQHVAPYLNVAIAKPLALTPISSAPTIVPKIVKPWICHPTKPQYLQPAVFVVKADKQFDVYHLHAYGKQKELVYYNVAGIQTYKQSVMMNRIFRHIRENDNLDYIEESEDEDDFQNLSATKYVDLEKAVLMECVFHTKLKLWIPEKVVEKKNVVHISAL